MNFFNNSSQRTIYAILLLCVILTGIFFRFYNYENRWGLAYDQAHDAIVARYAIENKQFPLLGPFSSAGAFQTGGEWYWIIMAATNVYPSSVKTPWIVMTIVYIVFIFLIIAIGKELINKWFGLLVGTLAAVSTAQITQGLNLTNQSPLAFISLLCIWSYITFMRKKEMKYIFFLGLSIGTASSIHLQGIALLLLIPIVTFISRSFSIKYFVVLTAGLILPWLPVFWVDIHNNFSNTKNMLQYYLHDQYNVSFEVLGRRWLTYVLDFIPFMWSFVIGGYKLIGYILFVGLLIVSLYGFIKRNIEKEFLVLLLSSIFMFGLLRYTRTPLFESYIVFLHPFILLVTAWGIYKLYEINKLVGTALFCIVLIGSLVRTYPELHSQVNVTPRNSENWKEILKFRYPNKKFAIYDLKYQHGNKSLPLVLYLQAEKLLDQNGTKIGIGRANRPGVLPYDALITQGGELLVFKLDGARNTDLKEGHWAPVNPRDVYISTEEWYKYKK